MSEDQRNDGSLRDLHAMGNPDNRFTSSDGGYEPERNQFGAKCPTGIVARGARPADLWRGSSVESNRAIGKLRGPYLSRGT